MSWAEIKKINSDLVKPLNALITEKVSAISSWFNDTNNLITNQINTLKTGTVPAIKSIQRGEFDQHMSYEGDYGLITINAINPNKSILRVCSKNRTEPYARGKIEDATHIRLYPNYKLADDYYWTYSWEVIEFY